MDRRGFLKFMGVSVAATSASTVLAGIPEAIPKIELLEPKKVVTISDDVMVFQHIESYHIRQDENVSMFRGDRAINYGRREFTGEVTVFLNNVEMMQLTSQDMNIRKVMFDFPDLKDRLFVASSFQISSAISENITATLQVIEINNHGKAVM